MVSSPARRGDATGTGAPSPLPPPTRSSRMSSPSTEILSQRLASDPAVLELWRELVLKHLGFFWHRRAVTAPTAEEIFEDE